VTVISKGCFGGEGATIGTEGLNLLILTAKIDFRLRIIDFSGYRFVIASNFGMIYGEAVCNQI